MIICIYALRNLVMPGNTALVDWPENQLVF